MATYSISSLSSATAKVDEYFVSHLALQAPLLCASSQVAKRMANHFDKEQSFAHTCGSTSQTKMGRDLWRILVFESTRVDSKKNLQGFAYPSVFDPMDWLISQRLPSGSAKCAVRSPQGWLVGGLRNVTPLALSAS